MKITPRVLNSFTSSISGLLNISFEPSVATLPLAWNIIALVFETLISKPLSDVHFTILDRIVFAILQSSRQVSDDI